MKSADDNKNMKNTPSGDNSPDTPASALSSAVSPLDEGVRFHQEGRFKEAEILYQQVLKTAPENPDILHLYGILLHQKGNFQKANAFLRKAVHLSPENTTFWLNLGMALKDVQKTEEAIFAFEKVLENEPSSELALCSLVHEYLKTCEWEKLDPLSKRLDRYIETALANHQSVVETPFQNLARKADPQWNRRIAVSCSRSISAQVEEQKKKHPELHFVHGERKEKNRIRIGYISHDFRNHAVSHLCQKIFSLHTRKDFEIFCYSFGPDDKSIYRKNIMDNADRFHDIRELDEYASALRIHKDQVDILVDMTGYTRNHRMRTLALRPAPVQVHFLGYPGTTGADFMDYLIADSVVIPPAHRKYYTEALAILPHTYQVTDPEQEIFQKPFTREDFGLPEKGVVFCSFNQTYKIDPVIFDAWMDILIRVPGSVLWLFRSNKKAETILKKHSSTKGVDPDRLVFTENLSKPKHLDRYRLADICLDTRIVCGHTTTTDALFMEKPVITLRGTNFASRVSESILKAFGTEELVTKNIDEYKALAAELAKHPEKLHQISQKIRFRKSRSPVFDPAGFVRHLESAYHFMWERYMQNKNPTTFQVQDTMMNDSSPLNKTPARKRTGIPLISSNPEIRALYVLYYEGKYEEAAAGIRKLGVFREFISHETAAPGQGQTLPSGHGEHRADDPWAVILLAMIAQIKRDLPHAEAILLDLLQEQKEGMVCAFAFFILGTVQKERGKTDAAVNSFETAVRIHPEMTEAYVFLGNIFHEKGEEEKAISYFEKALSIFPDDPVSLSNMGNSYKNIGDIEKAMELYQKAMDLDPFFDSPVNLLLEENRHRCNWEKVKELEARLLPITEKKLAKGEKTAESPFDAMIRKDDPEFGFSVGKNWSNALSDMVRPLAPDFHFPNPGINHEKIRVGYLSYDFRNHATAHLMAGLLEYHDRKNFDIRLYSYGPDDGSAYRKRLIRSSDGFADIKDLSDAQAAQKIYTDGVEILVDLKGYTGHNRLAIPAMRPCQVQVAWLGFPGTTGGDFFDYIVTDHHVTPEEHLPYYAETPVFLPHTYQVTDNRQPIADRPWKRKEMGLPDDALVYCCFNQSYKIEERIFMAWMRILRRVPEGVLWLLFRCENSMNALRSAAGDAGVDPDRLIFAKLIPKKGHMARLMFADIGLDTLTVNGHTTTSDALWAGVPVITLAGNHFASRVSKSLLTAVGLPELVVKSMEEYEEKAVDLGQNPENLFFLKQRLSKNRHTHPLFNTPLFTRHLEKGFREISCLARKSEPPGAVHVEEIKGGFEDICFIGEREEEGKDGYTDETAHIREYARQYLRAGLNEDALSLYQKVMERNPGDAEARLRMGVLLCSMGKLDKGISTLLPIETDPDYGPETLYNLGGAYLLKGEREKAITTWKECVSQKPDYEAVYRELGNALRKEGRKQELLELFETAARHVENKAYYAYHAGNLHTDTGNTEESIQWFQLAAEHDPDMISAHFNLGVSFSLTGRMEEAASCFQRVLEISPSHFGAMRSLGNVYLKMEKTRDAVLLLEKAKETAPEDWDNWFHLGIAYKKDNQPEASRDAFIKATEIRPDHAESWHNLALVYQLLDNVSEEISCYEKVLAINPGHEKATNNMYLQLRTFCDWKRIRKMEESLEESTKNALEKEEKIVESIAVSFIRQEDPERDLALARYWSSKIAENARKHKTSFSFENRRTKTGKIVLGYLSNDFNNHPVAHLIVSLFGHHNRSRFHVTGYSTGKKDDSYYRQKIEKECDSFIDLENEPDHAVAQKIYDDQVDILVDLIGYTTNYRLGVMALRPAPVQVNFLGYPGTTGADFEDYIISDPVVSPLEDAKYYSEKIVFMPHTYQVNDFLQPISNRVFYRKDFNLPEDCFIFCAFNQVYKIEPVIFETWMQILRKAENSILWLLAGADEAKTNICKKARELGVDPARIHFAPRMTKPEHLSRTGIGDIFLDTRIVNGHTTTSDALWAGVPVLTILGRHFASRVAASLLHAADIPETITKSVKEYEEAALYWYSHPEELVKLKQRLAKNRVTFPLFHTPRFVKNLEKAYETMWDRFCRGLLPDHIRIEEEQKKWAYVPGFTGVGPGEIMAPPPSRKKHPEPDAKTKAEELVRSGVARCSKGEFAKGVELLEKALHLHPENGTAWYNLGGARLVTGNLEKAKEAFEKTLSIYPEHEPARMQKGIVELRLSLLDDAEKTFSALVEQNPQNPDAWYHLGDIFARKEDPKEAVRAFQKTLELHPEHDRAKYNLGVSLTLCFRFEEAKSVFAEILEHDPDHHEAAIAIAVAAQKMGNLEEAIQIAEKHLEKHPDHIRLRHHLGNFFYAKKAYQKAEINYRMVLRDSPMEVETIENLGLALRSMGQTEEAIVMLEKARRAAPSRVSVYNNLFPLLRQICSWGEAREMEDDLDRITATRMENGLPMGEDPFVSMMRHPHPPRNHAVAVSYSQEFVNRLGIRENPFSYEHLLKQGAVPKDDYPRLIRLGYVSGDFRNHPVTHLIAGVMEAHDRTRFSVYCYSYGKDDRSVFRRHIQNACDRFTDISGYTDMDAAQRIHGDQVDILVDLTGYTTGNRVGITASGPAPVQVSYLGFPGTMGASFYDYIISDKIVIPDHHIPFYQENPLRLPDCFQSAMHLGISEKPITRKMAGLPENAFVFCCFNQFYKIDKTLFSLWMDILKSCPDAVLWLVNQPEPGVKNLKNEAIDQGVNPKQLVFSPLVPIEEHLKRIRLADLFLDTRLYNGGATTSNTLWAGVPVLTVSGGHFASRMSESLLRAIGLPEMVADNLDSYRQLALELAKNPEKLAHIRNRLAANKTTHPLFRTKNFVRSLEKGYMMIFNRFQQGKPPCPLDVEPIEEEIVSPCVDANISAAYKNRSDEGRTDAPLPPPQPQTPFFEDTEGKETGKKEGSGLPRPTEKNVKTLLEKGIRSHESGDISFAKKHYKQILSVFPDHDHANHLLGVCYCQEKQMEKGLFYLKKAVEKNVSSGLFRLNYGKALWEAKKEDAALDEIQSALLIAPGNPELPYTMGLITRQKGDAEKALYWFTRTLSTDPDYAHAHLQRGLVHLDAERMDEALFDFERAYEKDPTLTRALSQMVSVYRKTCIWDRLPAALAFLEKATERELEKGEKTGEMPLLNLMHTMDQKRNLLVARSWAKDAAQTVLSCHEPFGPPYAVSGKNKGKITVGYVSADFGNDPVTHLIQGIFPLHDRNRFEVISYATTAKPENTYRKYIQENSDHFADISELSDYEAAEKIYADGVDILVDLMGHTKNTRLGIFSLRPAPVSLTYLGYPGSTGADYIDYILTDRVLTPDGEEPFYTEKIIRMPHTYQVTHGKQEFSQKPLSRKDFGLLEDAIVFCCFNQTYKIEPVIFAAWMRILKRVENAIFWLLPKTPAAGNRLKAEARKQGVDPNRLVFAEILPLDAHLARLSLSDIAVDTRIYNGGATTSNALFAGIPVVALKGGHYVSRMSESLLMAMGMQELVCRNLKEYEELAYALAVDAEKRKAIRQKIVKNRLTSPLFDTPRFVKNLESAYETLVQNYLEEKPAAGFDVKDSLQVFPSSAGKQDRKESLPQEDEKQPVIPPQPREQKTVSCPFISSAEPEKNKGTPDADKDTKGHPVNEELERGYRAFRGQDYHLAEKWFKKVLEKNPDDADATHYLGLVYIRQKAFQKGMEYLEKSLELDPDRFSFIANLGEIHKQTGDFAKAARYAAMAAERRPDSAGLWYNLGYALDKIMDYTGALSAFQKAFEKEPDHVFSYAAGSACQNMGRYREAVSWFQKSLSLKNDYIPSLNGLANVYSLTGNKEEAEKTYEKAISLSPDYPLAYFNLANLKIEKRDWEKAKTLNEKAVSLNPDFHDAINSLVYTCMHVCDWEGLQKYGKMLDASTKSALEKGNRPAEKPFESIIRKDMPGLNLAVARAWAAYFERTMDKSIPVFSHTPEHRHEKLRIGYLSNDFHDHATMHLMNSLFGLHNKQRFRIYAYSYGPDDGSRFREEVKKNCCQFLDIRNLSAMDAAKQIHGDEIDILVDLVGYTANSRPTICAYRPAPIQVAYLGFPGTLGAKWIDYAIVDRVVLPDQETKWFTETPVFMPHSYQINDFRQKIAFKDMTREDFGLPEKGFVFASFNQPYKIDPLMFDTWMEIMQEVPESVLWLFSRHHLPEKNLRAFAEKKGISKDRLLFTGKLPKDEHLNRIGFADLCLDTRIVNGHTTTSDSLWAGVPVITLLGRHFASRVSASLLYAMDLDGLVTRSLEEYKKLATDLAHHSEKLISIRQCLAKNRLTKPLFNTKRFADSLERVYEAIWKNWVSGNPPCIIQILDKHQAPDSAFAIPSGTKSKTDVSEIVNQANALIQEGRIQEGEKILLDTLVYHPLLDAETEMVNNRLGHLYVQQCRWAEAEKRFRNILQIHPDSAGAQHNLGLSLHNQDKLTEAIPHYEKAAKLKPDMAVTFHNMADAYRLLGNREKQSIEAFEKAYELDNSLTISYGSMVHQLQHICDFDRWEEKAEKLNRITDSAISQGKKAAETPFTNITRIADPAYNYRIARSFAQDIAIKAKAYRTAFSFENRKNHPDAGNRKIILGYLSNDFYEHATSHLIRALFSYHDRSRFQVNCYSYGKPSQGAMRISIMERVDRFVDIREVGDMDAAKTIFQDKVDILIDLKGYTGGHRLGIPALMPAPVQVSFLGFPGTTGADFLHYIITDKFVTPEAEAMYYSEKFAYMPYTYQVNDEILRYNFSPLTRKELGLPEDAFVFGSFNQNYKIDRPVFDAWLNILSRVKDSVLWLYRTNDDAEENLVKYAAEKGFDPARLVFAKKCPQRMHLNRISHMDLALDTTLVNGHTTTSDCLRMGVPVLAMKGKHFASRVSESLLHAIGLKELVARDYASYENHAVFLATHPESIIRIRQRLAKNRLTHPLYDIWRYRIHLEELYEIMWNRYLNSQPFAHISVHDTRTGKDEQQGTGARKRITRVHSLYTKKDDTPDMLKEAIRQHKMGNMEKALEIYEAFLKHTPNHPHILHLSGVAASQLKQNEKAKQRLTQAVSLSPENTIYIFNLANFYMENGESEKAEETLEKAVSLDPENLDFVFHLATWKKTNNKNKEAIKWFNLALDLNSGITKGAGHEKTKGDPEMENTPEKDRNNFRKREILHELGKLYRKESMPEKALHYLEQAKSVPDQGKGGSERIDNTMGLACLDMKAHDKAVACFSEAIRKKPDYAPAHNNLGNAWAELGEIQKGLESYKAALSFQPENAGTWINLGKLHVEEQQFKKAVSAFQKAISINPGFSEAYNNLGNVFLEMKRLKESGACFEKAISLKKDYYDAHNNLGVVLQESGNVKKAIEMFRKAAELSPDAIEPLHNMANAYKDIHDLENAIFFFEKVLEKKPDYARALSSFVHQLQHACAWKRWEELSPKLDRITLGSLGNEKEWIETPFISITRKMDPEFNFLVARHRSRAMASQVKSIEVTFSHEKRMQNSKIRVGYISHDFCDHPVAHLIAGLFSRHNRNHFEVFAYSDGPDDKSPFREKIRTSCDMFVNIREMDHEAVARQIYNDRVDILIDLMGHTRNNRLCVFSLRPAPVQITFLGFPGTTGADYMDYLVSDHVVTPDGAEKYYSEKLILLPHSYQVNDRQQVMEDKIPARKEWGIPEDGFLFTSFNQLYKLDQNLFSVWMRILKQVDKSILWLFKTNDLAEKNLKSYAADQGVDPERIFFSTRCSKDKHLNRLTLCDLFLDTWLVNGHTTTSDALFAGVPVITMKGGHFASRVSESLLKAVGLSELAVDTSEEYEQLAVHLARHPESLVKIRQRLAKNRITEPLFDTEKFAGNLEKGLFAAWKRFLDGKKPQSIRVEEA